MPQQTWLAAVGLAKDSANTTLTAAVAVGATSIPIAGTNVPASSTITFIDGPLTESRAVTAGGGSTTLTVAALTNAHSANCYVVSQLTASLGPADWMPITSLQRADKIIQLADQGLRGSAVTEYGNVDGTRMATITIGGPVFTDTFPYLIASVTGAVDFAGGTPNSFAFSVKNTGDTQPTPLLFFVKSAIDTRIFAGAKVTSLQISYDPSGLLVYTATLTAYSGGPVTGLAAPSYSAITPVPSWQCQATIAGTAVQYVRKFDVTVTRPLSPIYTLQGIQDPYKIFAGPQSAVGTLDCVMEDNTEMNRFVLNTQPSLDIKYTASGANPITLTVHGTKVNYTDANLHDTGQDYISIDTPLTFIANTTDATTAGTGYAPLKITATSTKATGTYT